MFPPHEAFYIDCLLWHTTSGRNSTLELLKVHETLKRNPNEIINLSSETILAAAQNIAHQSAAVSRYLWPSPTAKDHIHVARGDHLRKALAADSRSPLADRRLRNAIEHFDERLDTFLKRAPVGHFFPDYVDFDQPDSDVPLHIFKAYYAKSNVFILLGETYELTPIANELLRIHGRLMAAKANGYRL